MKNFVVVEHRTKSDNKSELVAFEKKVEAKLQKGYYLIMLTVNMIRIKIELFITLILSKDDR